MTIQIYKYNDYGAHCPFRGSHAVSNSSQSATQVLPASISIHQPKNFDSELQVTNAGLVQAPVLFSGWGEKLLESNKCLGSNLRQYGILAYVYL